MSPADLFSDGEPPPRRTNQPIAETLAQYDTLREENPDATTAELARMLGYPPKYLYKVLSANGRTKGRDGTEVPAAAKPTSKGRADLVTKLCDPIAKFAAAAAFAAPTLACVLIERGETTARALVAIAEDKPRMLAALENVSKVGPVSDLAETVFLGIIAAALDMGRLPLDHPLAVLTGNTGRYMKMHPEAAAAAANGPPPPPFPFTIPVPGMPVA